MKANILKLLLLWESKIPQNSENILKEKLGKISPENLSAFEEIPLKNPYIALCCCVFLGIFGIEDFYRNRNTLGALKLLLTTIASLLAIVVYIIVDEFDDIYIMSPQMISLLTIFAMILMLIVAIWVIINIFTISERIKKDNLALIHKYIAMIE